MRYLLTLATIDDDATDAEDISAAAANSCGEVYIADGAPVWQNGQGAVVLTLDELSALLNAATVGVDGIEEVGEREAVCAALDTLDVAAIAAQG